MRKVLIVEDDKDINRALRIRMEAAGYEVCAAHDGYMGLSAAVQQRPELAGFHATVQTQRGGASAPPRRRRAPFFAGT